MGKFGIVGNVLMSGMRKLVFVFKWMLLMGNVNLFGVFFNDWS